MRNPKAKRVWGTSVRTSNNSWTRRSSLHTWAGSARPPYVGQSGPGAAREQRLPQGPGGVDAHPAPRHRDLGETPEPGHRPGGAGFRRVRILQQEHLPLTQAVAQPGDERHRVVE
ncbi:hypothetical protein [Sphaerisporangium dianthi]|uniref:Uncharacterized protein n=1 Tax=Sphaerisporangium dianthi TaxID=1436120 RepID=A0ABV9CKH0_9ACTN